MLLQVGCRRADAYDSDFAGSGSGHRAMFSKKCCVAEGGTKALDKAGMAGRPTFVTASLQSLWAGVAAGLGITLRTSAGIPPQLKRLDGKFGLPPLPRVDVRLHAGGDPASPALRQLRRTVTEHALVELVGNKECMARGRLPQRRFSYMAALKK